MKNRKLPELLSPAGSPEAFRAAIDGGADAIYMGGASFNARINAQNFSAEEIREAVKLAHAYGVKVYQTVNTMVFDRERDGFIFAAEESVRAGIDAFIVSDLGAARLLRERLPEAELHASTQMSVHNTEGARFLAERGFSRVVPARELCAEDIKYMVDNAQAEVEIFIHGALCVSHSGQCLFSSLVGGRSGNRGLCAQPCRLPYACGGKCADSKYPLSLKDMSLATHVRGIVDCGVASLKIEGRMKSPEYVRGVTAVWRRLLDGYRDATELDMRELSELFSRGGFTDAYYTRSVGRGMLGVRSEQDKQASREIEKFNKIERRVPVDISVRMAEGEPMRLCMSCRDKSVSVEGVVPEAAINAPLDEQSVARSVTKLGSTCFSPRSTNVDISGRLIVPVSSLNALRREAVDKLMEKLAEVDEIKVADVTKKRPENAQKRRSVARFYSKEQITDLAREFFDVILLPLDKFVDPDADADGFVMPPVIFDSEYGKIKEILTLAAKKEPKYAVVSNLGQIDTVKELCPDAALIADFRFNVANESTLGFFEDQAFESTVVSAELSLPQIRDLGGSRGVVVYGRIPLMTLEKCVIKELYGDRNGCEICSRNVAEMTDRKGITFPILRELPHRNIVLNSLPTNMSDRQDELERANILDRHFIFTVESPDDVDRVIEAYKHKKPLDQKVRRI